MFFTIHSHSQTPVDQRKIFIDSSIAMLARKFSDINSSGNTGIQKIYLLDNHNRPYNFKSGVNNYEFATIELNGKKDKKKLKRGITAWIFSERIEQDKYIINISEFGLSLKANNVLHYSKGGGARFVFHYFCDQGKWVLEESSL
jgi:hypothetical protein